MHRKFEINRTKIKGGCLLGVQVVTQDSKSDLPLIDSRHFPLHCGPCGWANDAAGRFLATESAKLLNKSIPFDDAENFLYELSTNQPKEVCWAGHKQQKQQPQTIH